MQEDWDLPTAAFVCVGDELLSGEVRDENMSICSKMLAKKGIDLDEARILKCDIDDIALTIRTLKQRHNYVFICGGTGPTHSDITTEAIAGLLGLPLILNENFKKEAEKSLCRELKPSELKMLKLPKGATPIKNKLGIALGYKVENIYVLPGLPRVFASMMDEVDCMIKDGSKIQSVYIYFSVSEAEIASELDKVAEQYPKITISSYLIFGDEKRKTKVILRGISKKQVVDAERMLRRKLASSACDAPSELKNEG